MQIFYTNKQLLEGQIKRGEAALRAAEETPLDHPAVLRWLAALPSIYGLAPVRRDAMRMVLAIEAARGVSDKAARAIGLQLVELRHWRDIVAAARRNDKALNDACHDQVRCIQWRVDIERTAEREADRKARVARYAKPERIDSDVLPPIKDYES